MRIYIQSKSGNYNTVLNGSYASLNSAFAIIKSNGGYIAKDRSVEFFVPLQEVEHLREADKDE